MPSFEDENLIVGQAAFDDAGVYKLSPDLAIIQTLDFLTPMVDSPYLFGQIAAANSLSDVYAMGGKPLTAMNITAFPACSMDLAILRDILAGGADKIKEAGALLVGGHTIDDKEPKYGLSVTGIVHPGKIVTNAAAKPEDVLVLTKPIGTGIITTALKAEFVAEKDILTVVEEMARLNKYAYEAMLIAEIIAATDITGFGLLGHLLEMCNASNVSAEIDFKYVPVWPQAFEFANSGLVPVGSYNNRKYLEDKVEFAKNVDEAEKDILFDPQTSGGLLLSVDPQKLSSLKKDLSARNISFGVIGQLLPRQHKAIFVRKGY